MLNNMWRWSGLLWVRELATLTLANDERRVLYLFFLVTFIYHDWFSNLSGGSFLLFMDFIQFLMVIVKKYLAI